MPAIPASNDVLPIILVRGFGGMSTEDEIANTHQGFNTGTVYPHKLGENYIYEGMVLRFLKSMWHYVDATNVVGFYAEEAHPRPVEDESDVLGQLRRGALPQYSTLADAEARVQAWQAAGYLGATIEHDEQGPYRSGSVILDAKSALDLVMQSTPKCSLWVYRYYDLKSRRMQDYATQLAKLIDIICAITGADRVNVIAHSMGGLVVRALLQDPQNRFKDQQERINRLVTLGTPHKGIAFEVLPDELLGNLEKLKVADELRYFSPEKQRTDENYGFEKLRDRFDLDRLLCVVGTNYAAYDQKIASLLNRLFSLDEEGGLLYNRSDGLVKQRSAYVEGAHLTYVHKCHGGRDSLVTSREAYEIANRFFFGNTRVRLYFVRGKVKKSFEFFGFINKPEYFFGVSVRPRGVDFDLFHQSEEAENCVGPLRDAELSDLLEEAHGALCEVFVDSSRSLTKQGDFAMRLQFYLGERDLSVHGYADDLILSRTLYLQALATDSTSGDQVGYKLQAYDTTIEPDGWRDCPRVGSRWAFDLMNPYFEGTFEVDIQPWGTAPPPTDSVATVHQFVTDRHRVKVATRRQVCVGLARRHLLSTLRDWVAPPSTSVGSRDENTLRE